MKLLLDTHVLIWMDSEPVKLSARGRSLIVDPQNELLLSVVSLWEIQIKAMLGKLSTRLPLEQLVAEQQQHNQLKLLPIVAEHVYQLAQLPPVHNDPFDRLIASVARSENAMLLSSDAIFQRYPVTVVW